MLQLSYSHSNIESAVPTSTNEYPMLDGGQVYSSQRRTLIPVLDMLKLSYPVSVTSFIFMAIY